MPLEVPRWEDAEDIPLWEDAEDVPTWDDVDSERESKRAKIAAEIESKSTPTGPAWPYEIAGQLGEGARWLPARIVNLPAEAINAVVGRQVIRTVSPGEPMLPELLPDPDTMAGWTPPPSQYSATPKPVGPVVAGVAKGAEDLARGLTTPEMALVAPAGATRMAAAVPAIFSAQMIKDTPEAYAEFGRATVEGTPAEAWRAGVGALGSSAMIAHMAGRPVLQSGLGEGLRSEPIPQRVNRTPSMPAEEGGQIAPGEIRPVEPPPGVAMPEPRPEVASKPVSPKEQLFQEVFVKERVPDEKIKVTVSNYPEFPQANTLQIDYAEPGEVAKWQSTNPERLIEAGYDIPARSELMTLPSGKYTIAQAKEMLKAKPAQAPAPVVPVQPEAVKPIPLKKVPRKSPEGDALARNGWKIDAKKKAWIPPTEAPPAPPPVAPEPEVAKPEPSWASATDSIEPMAPESGPVGVPPKPQVPPDIQYRHAGIPLPKWPLHKMTPLDVATSKHSAKMQRSESEARTAMKEIRSVAKNERRQSAIAIWLEANGDIPTLQTWVAGAKGKKFKQAATDALTLTPEEIALGGKIRAAFDALHAKGAANDVISRFRDNYVTHIWKTPKKSRGFGGGVLKQNFRFNKARTFATFFEGDQAGFIPKTLVLEKIVPAYIKEMDSVIAARQFVKDMAGQLAPDGRPLVIPRGVAKSIEADPATGTTAATLVFPSSVKSVRDAAGDRIDQSDYRTMENHPALQQWRWVAEDEAGHPVMLQSDLALHPTAYKRIQSMLGTSALKQWYLEPSEGMARIPKAIAQGLDKAQSEMKRSMFGLLAPFHQVQEGTHAVGHTVNPFFGIPKVDLRNPAQLDAAAHGLMMLPDRASSASYLEGSGSQSSLLVRGMKKVPALKAIGEASDMYQDYLFHQYIPGLKFKTYEHILERNTKRYTSELASGDVSIKDIKLLSAEQANAAYGHLNYALLDRNPTIQHLLRLGALAPDFLEARGRFAGQAFKGLSSKNGQEQLRAIAVLAAVQAGSAIVLSQLLGVPYDPRHPFEVVYNGRRYAMRSVPEDLFGLVKDTRQFAYSRVNPLIVKGAIQSLTGKNYRGETVSQAETIAELLAGYIPITARSIPGLRDLTFTGRNQPVSPLEQLTGSLGLRISRYSPISETYKLAREWMGSKGLEMDRGSYPVSKYQKLRYALEDNDTDAAIAAYQELRSTLTISKLEIGFNQSVESPFTKNAAVDLEFKNSLKGYDLELYNLAVRRRKDILVRFLLLPKT